MNDKSRDTVLVYTVRRTGAWWKCVADEMGFGRSVVVSDIRGDLCDLCLVDDFYAGQRLFNSGKIRIEDYFSEAEKDDIIARCRVLRWLPKPKAVKMIAGMCYVFTKLLDNTNPAVIVSFPIDRYVSDVLERLGAKRNIPYYELTASLLPNMSMIMYRGQLVKFQESLDQKELAKQTEDIANPLFKPVYVQVNNTYNVRRFLKTFLYFRLRGWAFKALSVLKNDPLNLHYLDSQAFLGHKPSLSDVKITKMLDNRWMEKTSGYDKDRIVLFGLQLFPEASIDYWIDNLELVEHEDMLEKAISVLSASGYLILIKDHPLQYGFRQTAFLEKMQNKYNAVLVPYHVSGYELLDVAGVNFTCTGTLGMQSAMLGSKSIVVENYYSNEQDFVVIKNLNDIEKLPETLDKLDFDQGLNERQSRIIGEVMKGSFESDFFSFESFNKGEDKTSTKALGREFGKIVHALIAKR